MWVGVARSQNTAFGEAQNIGAISRIVIIFIAQNNEGEILNKEEVAGSKEEKMSTIIKTWRNMRPYIALKAISFFNLKS